MSIEANKLAMRRFVEFINSADEKLAAELIAPNAIVWVPGRPEPLKGLAGYMNILEMMRGGFSNVQWTLEETIGEGDRIAARFSPESLHLSRSAARDSPPPSAFRCFSVVKALLWRSCGQFLLYEDFGAQASPKPIKMANFRQE